MTTPVPLTGHDMLKAADAEAQVKIVSLNDILELEKSDQPRFDELDQDKVRGIAADILFRHTKNKVAQVDCLDVIPYVQEVPTPGNVQFRRVAGNHRINSYMLNGWEKIKVKVLPSDFFPRTGIPKGLFQVASSPKALQDGHDLKEIETQLIANWDLSPINGDKANALVWLRSIQQHYSDDQYDKMVNRVAKLKNKKDPAKQEADTLIRTYTSGKVAKNAGASVRLRNANGWFEDCRSALPAGGNWYRINASTRNLWNQTIGQLLTALGNDGVVRDEDGEYPEDREQNRILFSVKPDAPSKYTQENVKTLISTNLKKMIDVIEAHDLPIDEIWRYPQFVGDGEGQDDPKKGILLWTKTGGRVKK